MNSTIIQIYRDCKEIVSAAERDENDVELTPNSNCKDETQCDTTEKFKFNLLKREQQSFKNDRRLRGRPKMLFSKKKKEDWQEREGRQFRLRVIQVRITNKSLIAKAKRLEKRMLMVILYLTKHVVDQLREKRHVIS